MLIIKKSQLEQLSAHLRDRYVRTMIAHVKTEFPDRHAIFGDDRVRELIESGIGKGERFGLASEQDVGALIHFMFLTEPDFDLRPDFQWAVDALRTGDLEPAERVDLLYRRWREQDGGKR